MVLFAKEWIEVLLSVHEFPATGAATKTQPDVILIHGTGADASLWARQVELLNRAGHRCLVPELRGHGSSHEPGEPTDLFVHCQDVLDTLEIKGVSYPAVWIGHSLGAIISMVLAEKRPELFLQVLAISMPGRVPRPVATLFRFLTTWPMASIKGTLLHKSLPKRERILVATELFSLQQIVRNFASVDFVEKLPAVTCPVHFSVGRLDVVAPYIHVERMHRNLPGSTYRLFEWAGHCVMDDQPEQFDAWLIEKVLNGSVASVVAGASGQTHA